MPRSPRLIADQGIFHLIARGNNRTKLCKKALDFLQLKSRLTYYTATYGIAVYHYAIMRTHLHLLAFVEDTKMLCPFFKAFQISYFHYFKREYDYEGHLWHGRYASIVIQEESHYLQAGRYIELNPVKAKIAEHPNSYPWSSYHFYAHGKMDSLITANPQYLEWGKMDEERQKRYQNFILLDAHFEKEAIRNVA